LRRGASAFSRPTRPSKPRWTRRSTPWKGAHGLLRDSGAHVNCSRGCAANAPVRWPARLLLRPIVARLPECSTGEA
jgi:hypothetical protein